MLTKPIKILFLLISKDVKISHFSQIPLHQQTGCTTNNLQLLAVPVPQEVNPDNVGFTVSKPPSSNTLCITRSRCLCYNSISLTSIRGFVLCVRRFTRFFPTSLECGLWGILDISVAPFSLQRVTWAQIFVILQPGKNLVLWTMIVTKRVSIPNWPNHTGS